MIFKLKPKPEISPLGHNRLVRQFYVIPRRIGDYLCWGYCNVWERAVTQIGTLCDGDTIVWEPYEVAVAPTPTVRD